MLWINNLQLPSPRIIYFHYACRDYTRSHIFDGVYKVPATNGADSLADKAKGKRHTGRISRKDGNKEEFTDGTQQGNERIRFSYIL